MALALVLVAGLVLAGPAEVFAQGHVSIGVGVGFGVSGYPVHVGGYYHYPYYRYGYPWYPYGFGYPYPYAYAPIYPYPYYDPTAGLKLLVTPRQTEVYVDGYLAGVVDNFDGTFQQLDLSPGEHDLELFLPGHRLVHKSLYLQPGKTSKLKLMMEPLGPGEPEPVRPSGKPLPPPPSQQQQQQQQGVQGQQGPPTRRAQQGSASRPAPPPSGDTGITVAPTRPGTTVEGEFGSLSVRVQPSAATILIDGEKWESANSDERLELQIGPGRHVV